MTRRTRRRSRGRTTASRNDFSPHHPNENDQPLDPRERLQKVHFFTTRVAQLPSTLACARPRPSTRPRRRRRRARVPSRPRPRLTAFRARRRRRRGRVEGRGRAHASVEGSRVTRVVKKCTFSHSRARKVAASAPRAFFALEAYGRYKNVKGCVESGRSFTVTPSTATRDETARRTRRAIARRPPRRRRAYPRSPSPSSSSSSSVVRPRA